MAHATTAPASARETTATHGLPAPGARSAGEPANDQWSKARDVQAMLSPHVARDLPGVDAAAFCQSALGVGGDYCDVWPLADGRLAFALGDVSGKGLPAAMVMAHLRGLVRTAVSFCPEPSTALAHVNQLLCDVLSDSAFATLVLGVLDPATGSLDYVNAGHLPPVVVDPRGEAHPLGRPRHLPLGMIREASFETDNCVLSSGSALVLVTDGVTEAFAPDGRMFGLAGLRRVLETSRGGGSGRIARALATAVAGFRQPLPQQDDVAVLVLVHRGDRRAGATGEADRHGAPSAAESGSWSAWCPTVAAAS